jgi:mono/diheme cytochrome c family protein
MNSVHALPLERLARHVRAASASASAAALLGLIAAVPLPAQADGPRGARAPVPAAYTTECGACHTAYPPGLLPAASWQRLMGGLDRHFGTDASLDTTTLREIGPWLQAHAGTDRPVAGAPPEDRITRSAWFERKHRQIDPAVWKLPSVKSRAQCSACHQGADQGRFDDDALIEPKGLTPAQRRAWSD